MYFEFLLKIRSMVIAVIAKTAATAPIIIAAIMPVFSLSALCINNYYNNKMKVLLEKLKYNKE